MLFTVFKSYQIKENTKIDGLYYDFILFIFSTKYGCKSIKMKIQIFFIYCLFFLEYFFPKAFANFFFGHFFCPKFISRIIL